MLYLEPLLQALLETGVVCCNEKLNPDNDIRQ